MYVRFKDVIDDMKNFTKEEQRNIFESYLDTQEKHYKYVLENGDGSEDSLCYRSLASVKKMREQLDERFK